MRKHRLEKLLQGNALRLKFQVLVILGWSLLTSLPGFGAPAPHRAPHVAWLENVPWPTLVAQARTAGRPILIDFYATWCGPCKVLDAMVYNETEVIRELRDVLTFKVDVDKPEYDELEEEFGITNLPTLVYCGSDGVPWARFTGYVSADTFLVRIRRWKKGLAAENDFMARLESAPNDPAVLLAAYHRRMREGRTGDASVYKQRLLGMTDGTRRPEAARMLLVIAADDQSAGSPAAARDLARNIETMFPADGPDLGRDVRRDDLAALGQLASFQNQLPDTLGVLETYSHMINLDRGCMEASEGFARTALAAGIRLPQATTCALRAVIRSDNRPDLVALLAECYDRRSFHARAVRWMEKAVAQDPDNADFRSALARYRASCPPWLLSSP